MLQQIYPQVSHPYQYELNKDMAFAAAHFIPNEQAGSCANLHGHTYFVNLTVAGNELDDCGFLVNFQQLKKLVHKEYDHITLNDHPHYTSKTAEVDKYPTTEVLAETIWKTVQSHLDQQPNRPKCLQVFVRETPTSYVIYRPKLND
jgi:6-pyruvoyltetrahydropterin/6-carboxytetrahydropterin synthase